MARNHLNRSQQSTTKRGYSLCFSNISGISPSFGLHSSWTPIHHLQYLSQVKHCNLLHRAPVHVTAPPLAPKPFKEDVDLSHYNPTFTEVTCTDSTSQGSAAYGRLILLFLPQRTNNLERLFSRWDPTYIPKSEPIIYT